MYIIVQYLTTVRPNNFCDLLKTAMLMARNFAKCQKFSVLPIVMQLVLQHESLKNLNFSQNLLALHALEIFRNFWKFYINLSAFFSNSF